MIRPVHQEKRRHEASGTPNLPDQYSSGSGGHLDFSPKLATSSSPLGFPFERAPKQPGAGADNTTWGARMTLTP